MDEKYVPGVDARAAAAGPHTTFDNDNPDKGMPHVAAPGLGYALPPRLDGMVFARPFICTSVDSRNQHVSGYVLFEPKDRIPVPDSPGESLPVGPYSVFVSNIPMGSPSQPNTVHWMAANYVGRSDGPGLTPIGATEVVRPIEGSLPTGNSVPMPDSAPPAGHEPEQAFDAADANKDHKVTAKEQRQYDRQHEHEKPLKYNGGKAAS